MPQVADVDDRCFQLFVWHGRSITIEGLRQSDDVARLLIALNGKVGVPYSAARLDYGGKPLQEGRTLAYYGLDAGSTVQLALRGRGGGCGVSKTADGGGSAMSLAAFGMPPTSVKQEVPVAVSGEASAQANFPVESSMTDEGTFNDNSRSKLVRAPRRLLRLTSSLLASSP